MDLKFVKIDKDLLVYRNKKIVIFGTGSVGMKIFHVLQKYNFEVSYFCDNDMTKMGTQIDNIDVISFTKLQEIAYDSDIIVQIASTYEAAIMKQLDQVRRIKYITYHEFCLAMFYLDNVQLSGAKIISTKQMIQDEGNLVLLKKTLDADAMISQCIRVYNNTLLFSLAPPKTGSTTVCEALKRKGYPIIVTSHGMRCVRQSVIENKDFKIKIICGVREPISQAISEMFDSYSIFKYDNHFLENNAVQDFFEQYYQNPYIGVENSDFTDIRKIFLDSSGRTYDELLFFDNEIKRYWGIDVYDYEFDKYAGYTIINKENIEILIYQLEKLSDLYDIIKDFIGIVDIDISSSNRAVDEWYSISYKLAKRNIKMKKEYIDRIYSDKFIKHFYNQDDIQKFYSKWILHIEK